MQAAGGGAAADRARPARGPASAEAWPAPAPAPAAVELAKRLLAAGHEPRSRSDLGSGAAHLPKLIQAGIAVRIGRDLYAHRDALSLVAGRVGAIIADEGAVTSRACATKFGTSRKYAEALLEHLDTARFTKRLPDEFHHGHERCLNQHDEQQCRSTASLTAISGERTSSPVAQGDQRRRLGRRSEIGLAHESAAGSRALVSRKAVLGSECSFRLTGVRWAAPITAQRRGCHAIHSSSTSSPSPGWCGPTARNSRPSGPASKARATWGATRTASSGCTSEISSPSLTFPVPLRIT
jgi:hypothetical protein